MTGVDFVQGQTDVVVKPRADVRRVAGDIILLFSVSRCTCDLERRRCVVRMCLLGTAVVSPPIG